MLVYELELGETEGIEGSRLTLEWEERVCKNVSRIIYKDTQEIIVMSPWNAQVKREVTTHLDKKRRERNKRNCTEKDKPWRCVPRK